MLQINITYEYRHKDSLKRKNNSKWDPMMCKNNKLHHKLNFIPEIKNCFNIQNTNQCNLPY